MLQAVTRLPIIDILKNPQEYITSYTDEVLLKVEQPDSPVVMLMLGYNDERQSYYFVVEDDYNTQDIYCEREELVQKFYEILHNIVKENRTMIKLREYSIEIVELFEELLEKHNITIPDEDRTGDESEARLYGTTYYDLEEDVVHILSKLVLRVKKLPDAEIDVYNL